MRAARIVALSVGGLFALGAVAGARWFASIEAKTLQVPLGVARSAAPSPVDLRNGTAWANPNRRPLMAYLPSALTERTRAVHMATPEFPCEARRICLKGSVIVEVLVREDGSVCDARILKGMLSNPKLFDDPVRIAMLKSKFRAGRNNGRPVATVVALAVRVGQ